MLLTILPFSAILDISSKSKCITFIFTWFCGALISLCYIWSQVILNLKHRITYISQKVKIIKS